MNICYDWLMLWPDSGIHRDDPRLDLDLEIIDLRFTGQRFYLPVCDLSSSL